MCRKTNRWIPKVVFLVDRRKLWSPGFNINLPIKPYFHRTIVQMTSNGPGHSISYKTTCPLSNDRVIVLMLISQTSKLSLDERWAYMQSCRKCSASTEISEILLVGFIFMKFPATPLLYTRIQTDGKCTSCIKSPLTKVVLVRRKHPLFDRLRN